MLHVLIGKDDFAIRQALNGIKKGIGDAEARMPNTSVLDGRQVTLEQLRNACETVPFLSEKRLVVVEGLFERFGGGNKKGRKKKSGQSAQPEECNVITDCIKELPEFTELVIIGGEVNTGNPLLREISSFTRIKSFPLLKKSQLSQWITQRVKTAGGTISPQAVDLLGRFVGNDLWTMSNEVDKLVSFVGGRRIEEGDIRVVVSYAQEASIFAMIDAVLEFRVGIAQELLQQLFKHGVAPAQILVMLSRQVRIIFQMKEMRSQKKTRADIQSKLGLTSDFVIRKAWDQADRYSTARLREVYHRILETDISIKTGKLEGEVALNILFVELGQRGAVSA